MKEISNPPKLDDAASYRVELAALLRLVALKGWDDFLSTHISCRIPGTEDQFLMNPLGLCFEEVCASNLVAIDLDGNQLSESPYEVNPAGFTIHSAVYRARPDVNFVIHLHTDDGVAVSAMEHGLLPISQHALKIGPVSYHDYEGVALDLSECERIGTNLGQARAMIFRNHGTLAVGPTANSAFAVLYHLERACTIQVRTLAAAKPILVSEKVALKTAAQSEDLFDGRFDPLSWAAWLRRLDRVDNSYRD